MDGRLTLLLPPTLAYRGTCWGQHKHWHLEATADQSSTWKRDSESLQPLRTRRDCEISVPKQSVTPFVPLRRAGLSTAPAGPRQTTRPSSRLLAHSIAGDEGVRTGEGFGRSALLCPLDTVLSLSPGCCLAMTQIAAFRPSSCPSRGGGCCSPLTTKRSMSLAIGGGEFYLPPHPRGAKTPSPAVQGTPHDFMRHARPSLSEGVVMC